MVRTISASILTIGDELLIGQVIDTNSAWISQELNKTGVWVNRRVAVGDVWDAIWNALDEEGQRSDIILITGGLGPTRDDITKQLLCQYFDGKIITDEGALENVKTIFSKLNVPMLEANLKQAEVPDCCTVIQNTRGTAPGMWFEKNGKIFVSMPGVPHEMKAMMSLFVLPQLKQRFEFPHIAHRTLLTAGIGESFLAERLTAFEENLPSNIKLAYLPATAMVRLRLTAVGDEKNPDIETELNNRFATLLSLTHDVTVADEDIPFEEAIGKLLLKYNKTLSTAESCTGGYIAHLLTAIPGASAYFIGSVVSYANRIKMDVLGVDATIPTTVGVVSEECVREMVSGAIHLLKTNYAIAVSGILGPGGGTPEKPVGTVWIAVGNGVKTEAKKFNFRFDRTRNMQLTTVNAFLMLRKMILEDNSET